MARSETRSLEKMEVWAGVECTVNRVGNCYFDQMKRSGHDSRIEDVERLAGLGIKALRYPMLWERFAQGQPWSWATERLSLLNRLGVRPIVGLVHHGSGPAHTSLLDPEFAEGLADHATDVAKRYPWIDGYTPVNEPLTTARFSALYGYWYPHKADDRNFAVALLNQSKATVLAMQAVRAVNPAAQLVQTEDLGFTHATDRLKYQADFENQRRWLTWDLLCGHVDRLHPLWNYLTSHLRLPVQEIAWFGDHPCPPNVLGINHYVTSERYLDDRLERYPRSVPGGNGKDAYADVEAVRILHDGGHGLRAILKQAWDRYRIPIAVTEVHLGCSREEQVRWLNDVWTAAGAAKREGTDVRAVTAWSAFGAYDWDSLVTCDRGNYEPGLFDVRCTPPRATALATAVRQLSHSGTIDHPVVEDPGWWKRQCRLLEPAATVESRPRGLPILITDGDGRFGRAFAAACERRGLACVSPKSGECDTLDAAGIQGILGIHTPWAVIHTGGFSRIDAAEADPDRCRRANLTIPVLWAVACEAYGCKMLHFSSDFVFDGRSGQPYCEGDEVRPLSVFGSTKAEAETAILATSSRGLIVRTGAIFGKCGVRDFVATALRTVRSGGVVAAADDLTMATCYLPDFVHTLLDLLIDDERGLFHLASPEPMTLAELARLAVQTAGFDGGRIEGRGAATFGWPAPRPVYVPLVSERGASLPSIRDSLERYVREVDWHSVA